MGMMIHRHLVEGKPTNMTYVENVQSDNIEQEPPQEKSDKNQLQKRGRPKKTED